MKAETGVRLIGILRAAYPARDLDPNTAEIYCALLADFNDAEAERAVIACLRRMKFFPSVSEIVAEILASGENHELTVGEAWENVQTAIRRGSSAYLNQSPGGLVRHVVDQIGWSKICHSENADTIRAHFMRLYEAALEKWKCERAVAGAPQSFRELEARASEMRSAGALVANLLPPSAGEMTDALADIDHRTRVEMRLHDAPSRSPSRKK